MALILSERERMGAHALDAFVKQVLTKEIPSMTSRSSAASKTSETRKRQPSEARATTPQHGSSWGDFLGPECAENSKARFCVVLTQRNSSSLVEALSEKYLHDWCPFCRDPGACLASALEASPQCLGIPHSHS
ncbi:protein disulfide isomerase (PDI) protein [Cyanidiococcus yangmingshanensis]|uniref:Protein disulfide isomerase (PDI) protein n=1 Tax=Cyanidiococcus yangmingshanensis TaxID=2690220 RepID=A0A7J7II61_9RHOD|nr:protein disulfide isomerase (PDI) protein [Cyanidiococcus yangmingshanensis]